MYNMSRVRAASRKLAEVAASVVLEPGVFQAVVFGMLKL